MTAIEREITIGDIRLIQGDMRAVLPELDARASLCLSDAPYPLTSGGRESGEMGGCFGRDAYDNSGALFDLVAWDEMAPLIRDALLPDANAVIMTSDRELARAQGAFEGAGFHFHHILVWDKGTATPNRYYMACCEFALFLKLGRARTITDPGSKQLMGCPQRDVSHLYVPVQHFEGGRRPAPHPTEKPVALMSRWLVNSTDPGDLVLDPFMGAGATVIAAAETGRAAIGIEKDPKWFDVAVARVREVVARKGRVAVWGGSDGVQSELVI